MTLTVIAYDDSTGEITDFRYEVDHDYSPSSDEIVVDNPDYHLRSVIDEKKVDTSVDPPEVVDDSDSEWDRPILVDEDTREIISSQFEAAGSDAIQADSAIQSNSNIPQEVKDYTKANIQMQYLIYISLFGNRIETVEDEYFPVE